MRQTDATRHALGVFAQLPFACALELDLLDQFVDPLAAYVGRDVEQTPVEIQCFFGIEEPVQVRLLRQVADSLVLGHVGGGLPKHQGFAFGGKQQSQQQF